MKTYLRNVRNYLLKTQQKEGEDLDYYDGVLDMYNEAIKMIERPKKPPERRGKVNYGTGQ